MQRQVGTLNTRLYRNIYILLLQKVLGVLRRRGIYLNLCSTKIPLDTRCVKNSGGEARVKQEDQGRYHFGAPIPASHLCMDTCTMSISTPHLCWASSGPSSRNFSLHHPSPATLQAQSRSSTAHPSPSAPSAWASGTPLPESCRAACVVI